MIRDSKYLIELQHILMEQMFLKYVKVKWLKWETYFLKAMKIKSYYNHNKDKYKWSILINTLMKIKQCTIKIGSSTPDHSYRILIIGDSGSGKTNLLLNLIDSQPDIDKMCLYAKDPYEPKYQYLINKREPAGIKYFKDPKAFIEYSNDMCDVCKNISYYNPNKENEILPVFDDMIADMINNKKQNSIVTELFIRGRKYFSCF